MNLSEEQDIKVAFKNLSWTRVVALKEFEEGSTRCYKLTDDILEGLKEMEEIELTDLSMLLTHFDPIRWQAQNPHPHLCVYKLNPEQLKDWGEVVTEIRQKIVKKAENYKLYSTGSQASLPQS